MELTKEFVASFSLDWVDSWNSHDIERILSHYADGFVIESPLAAERIPETGGIVKGKHAVREYWTIGLQNNSNLEFQILDVLIGINGLTIYYVNKANDRRSVEVMRFDDQMKVNYAIVHYAELPN